jgi:hypothetical protein
MFKKGDRVYVTDPALARLREIMRSATGQEPAPNHHGTVEDPEFGGGQILIYFDDGGSAPYPESQIRPLTAGKAG